MEDRVRIAIDLARDALHHDAQICRYHGANFERLGMAYGLPRCESCRQPFRVMRALTTLEQLLLDEDRQGRAD